MKLKMHFRTSSKHELNCDGFINNIISIVSIEVYINTTVVDISLVVVSSIICWGVWLRRTHEICIDIPICCMYIVVFNVVSKLWVVFSRNCSVDYSGNPLRVVEHLL